MEKSIRDCHKAHAISRMLKERRSHQTPEYPVTTHSRNYCSPAPDVKTVLFFFSFFLFKTVLDNPPNLRHLGPLHETFTTELWQIHDPICDTVIHKKLLTITIT